MSRLLTPMALSVLVLSAGTAAAAQSSLRPGEIIQARLSNQDSTLADGSFYRCYQVQTEPGRAYSVTMSSSDFDAYLAAGPGTDCSATTLINDDGPDMGTDARLEFLSTGGPWIIRANSLGEGETGRFSLGISVGERIEPTTDILPIAVGESRQGQLSFSDRRADDGSFYDCYALNLRQAETVAIRLDSGDFDAYLGLYDGGRCEGVSRTSDDDSGGGTSAQILESLRPGTYSIRANTLSASEKGDYVLTITARR